MTTPTPRIRLSATEIAAGEVVEVRTQIVHAMETGNRVDTDGMRVPRNIIHSFTAEFDGTPVFACDIDTAVAANPFLQFSVAPARSGVLTMRWRDEEGMDVTATRDIKVV